MEKENIKLEKTKLKLETTVYLIITIVYAAIFIASGIWPFSLLVGIFALISCSNIVLIKMLDKKLKEQ